MFLNRFSKNTHNRFYKNPSSGREVVPCGQPDKQTDIRKLIVAFCNFVKAPENKRHCSPYNPSSRHRRE
jgi:hypothetical protein